MQLLRKFLYGLRELFDRAVYATCSQSNTVILFVDEMHEVQTNITHVAVVTGCGDGIARCFDAKTGVMKRTLKGHEVSINTIQV
jgi:hypothetical protein